MAFIFVDREDDLREEMRDNVLRRNMRGHYSRRGGSMTSRDMYRQGYRQGYKHGVEDYDDEDMDDDAMYRRRRRNSRGEFI